MKTKLIACEMLRPEIEAIQKETETNYDTIWIEPGLHATPQLLNGHLKEIFGQLSDCDRVLMPFGDCGGALKNLETGDFEVILPKVDDCLTLLLGSVEKRIKIAKEMPTFFLSLGWLKQEKNIIAGYHDMVRQYGEDMAKMLTETMYGGYRRVALIDTGIGNEKEFADYEKPLKEIFGFEKYPVQGTTAYLKKLLTGPWEESFFRIAGPHTKL